MNTVPQTPTTREQLNELIAELYGDTPTCLSTVATRWQDAVTQVTEQLRAKLRVDVLPERLRKALEFVRANAVTVHEDGTASVQSGKQTYTLAPDCPCADAKHRAELCKHALAVELHRRALALFHGTAGELPPAPAAPSASQPAAAAALSPAAPSAPTSAAWDVHEAPVSSCFKIRVGTLEWTHTMRASDDAELHTRLQTFLPTFREIAAALEALHAEREAAKAAPATPAPQTLAPQPASAPADLQTLLQQAVQQALAAANGQTHGTPPLAAPSAGQRQAKAKTGDQATGLCSLHHVAMEHRENERGSWYSHWLPEEERHCKGRR
jgi:hypothetical protein